MFKINSLSGLQIFQLLRYGAFVLIGVFFAKLQVPQTNIGQFETFILLSGMVSFFWVSGIINTMLSVYPKKDEGGKKELLFNTFAMLVICSVLAGLALFGFSNSLLAFLNRDNGNALITLSVIYLLINGPTFLIEYVFYLANQRGYIIAYGIINAALTLIAGVLPVLLGYNIIYSVYGLIVVAGLRLLLLFILLLNRATFKLNVGLLTESLRLAAPLILSIFVSGSAEYIDGLIVKSKFDNMFFAVYRYGARELPVLLIVANTFSTGMIPVIAENLTNGLAQLKQRTTRLMHLFFPLTIVLLLCSPYLYKYVFSENFIYSALIFNIYLLLIIPRVLFPQTILTANGQPKYLLISSVFEIPLNVSLSIYLAGIIGLPGIAIGTFVAYTFDKVFLLLVNRFVFKIKPQAYVNLTLYFVYVTATIVAFIAGYYILKLM